MVKKAEQARLGVLIKGLEQFEALAYGRRKEFDRLVRVPVPEVRASLRTVCKSLFPPKPNYSALFAHVLSERRVKLENLITNG
jgi:hypothetical protein